MYLVFLVGFIAGALWAIFIFVYGLFNERFYLKALVMAMASTLAAFGMWRRFRNPPKDPIFERE